VLVSAVDIDVATAIGERIRLAFDAGKDGPTVTASIGLALRHAGEDFDVLIKRTDEALYHAKTTGRDRLTAGSWPGPDWRDDESDSVNLPSRSSGSSLVCRRRR
jgi:diguanylate cyclase with GGDEF domain